MFYKNCITVSFLNTTNFLNMHTLHTFTPLLNKQKEFCHWNTPSLPQNKTKSHRKLKARCILPVICLWRKLPDLSLRGRVFEICLFKAQPLGLLLSIWAVLHKNTSSWQWQSKYKTPTGAVQVIDKKKSLSSRLFLDRKIIENVPSWGWGNLS